MADFITLTCPSCGGKLKITQEVDRFACANCGNEHLVNRRGNTVWLSAIEASAGKVGSGLSKTASEMAIERLKGELAAFPLRIDSAEIEVLELQKKIQEEELSSHQAQPGEPAAAGDVELAAAQRELDRLRSEFEARKNELRQHYEVVGGGKSNPIGVSVLIDEILTPVRSWTINLNPAGQGKINAPDSSGDGIRLTGNIDVTNLVACINNVLISNQECSFTRQDKERTDIQIHPSKKKTDHFVVERPGGNWFRLSRKELIGFRDALRRHLLASTK